MRLFSIITLSLSILTTSFIDSLANSDTENLRYEKIEDDFITIKDVLGNPHTDIEIKGNTLVNLADINSVFKDNHNSWYEQYTICETSKLKIGIPYTFVVFKDFLPNHNKNEYNYFEIGLGNDINAVSSHPTLSIETDKSNIPSEHAYFSYGNSNYEVVKAKVIFKDFKNYRYLSARPCRRYSTPVDNEYCNSNIKLVLLEGDYMDYNIPYFTKMLSTGEGPSKELSLNISNKNIINSDIDFFTNKKIDSNGTEINSIKSNLSDFIQIDGGNRYYYNNELLGVKGVKIIQYDSNYRYLSQNYLNSNILHIDKGTKYIRVELNNEHISISDFLNYGQLEKSNLYTKYLRGNLKTGNIHLKEPLRSTGNSSDKIKRIGRKWYIERNCSEVIFDGSSDEGWKLNTSSDKIFEDYIVFHQNIGRKSAISDKFPVDHISNDAYEHIRVTDDYTFVYIKKSRLETLDLAGFNKWLSENPIRLVYQLDNNYDESLNFKFNLDLYENVNSIYSDSFIPAKLIVRIDRVNNIAMNYLEEAVNYPSDRNISVARLWTNQMPESSLKEAFQFELNKLFNIENSSLDRLNATSNLDIYIKSQNMIGLSLNTSSITFEDFDGVDDIDKANAVELSVNSSLPYDINVYLPNEIENATKDSTMDIRTLEIKESNSQTYNTFTGINTKLTLKENNIAGNNKIHSIDIKLKGGYAYKKDTYKATLKFEISQR